ncbi:MAG: YihY family inner membrane protein [Brevinematales bacterium]|nr:YihY family inner membrane protein [Brevinematales bacterium]
MEKTHPAIGRFFSAIGRFFQRLWQYIEIIYKKFNDDLCFQGASALSFNTVLSLVPLFTLVLAIITSMQAFQGVENNIKQFIFDRFIPEQAQVIENYIEEFSRNLQAMNIISIIGVLLAGVFLLVSLENFLNKIWKVKKQRGFIRSIINYWTVLTLGPIFLGGSFYITELMKQYALIHPFLTGITAFITSYSLNTALMFLMYYVMPFHKVKIRAALGGALFSGFCYEILRTYFGEIPAKLNYDKIYGAVAILPIFLFWIYLIWITILIGAEIAYFIQYPPSLNKKFFSNSNIFIVELSVFFYIVRNYLEDGIKLEKENLSMKLSDFDPEMIRRALDTLSERSLILLTDERGYIPYSEPVKQNLGAIIGAILGIREIPVSEMTGIPEYRQVLNDLNTIIEKHFHEDIFKLLDKETRPAVTG